MLQPPSTGARQPAHATLFHLMMPPADGRQTAPPPGETRGSPWVLSVGGLLGFTEGADFSSFPVSLRRAVWQFYLKSPRNADWPGGPCWETGLGARICSQG